MFALFLILGYFVLAGVTYTLVNHTFKDTLDEGDCFMVGLIAGFLWFAALPMLLGRAITRKLINKGK